MSSHDNSETPSKVGRHRLYSNEQRKDRNRKAQAAFRVRRNKYTEALELESAKKEEIIQELKEANKKSILRAEIAEQRCVQLDSQVASLQKLLQIALAENEHKNSSVSSSEDVFAAKWLEEMNHNAIGEFIKIITFIFLLITIRMTFILIFCNPCGPRP